MFPSPTHTRYLHVLSPALSQMCVAWWLRILASLLLSAALGRLLTHTCASVTKQYNLGSDALQLGR